MYTLLIDGNFFLRRILGVATLTFTETPDEDRKQLLEKLAQSLSATVREHYKHINNIVIARDYSSWRKTVDVVKPIESNKISDDSDYKDNRKADSNTDWTKVYACFDEFCNILQSSSLSVPIIRTKGAEGDDIMWVVPNMLKQMNRKTILWSSDGDAIQTVDESIHYFKLPKKTIYLPKSMTPTENNDFSIFGKTVDPCYDSFISTAQDGVRCINPDYVLLMKIVKGDGKDNVSPLFFWKTAKTTAKPRTAQIEKALAAVGLNETNFTSAHIYDDNKMEWFIQQLMVYTKQYRDLEHTVNVFKSNRRLLALNAKEIPETVINDIVTVTKHQLTQYKPNLEKLKSYANITNALKITETKSIFDQFDIA